MSVIKHRPSPAMIVAVLGLFVGLSSAGMAATGGNFILGKSNSAGAKTSLTAGVSDRALAITNMNTGPSATGLGLNVATNRPPLIVNSSTEVANLNADLLDGVDSGGFIRGHGSTQFTRRVLSVGETLPVFVTVSGIGSFAASCDAGPLAAIHWTTPTNVDGSLVYWSGFTSGEEFFVGTNVVNLSADATNPTVVSMWQLWRTDGTRRATVWFTEHRDFAQCLLEASVLVQTS